MSSQELQALAEEVDKIGNHALDLFNGGLVNVNSVLIGIIVALILCHACGKCIKHLTELIKNIKEKL